MAGNLSANRLLNKCNGLKKQTPRDENNKKLIIQLIELDQLRLDICNQLGNLYRRGGESLRKAVNHYEDAGKLSLKVQTNSQLPSHSVDHNIGLSLLMLANADCNANTNECLPLLRKAKERLLEAVKLRSDQAFQNYALSVRLAQDIAQSRYAPSNMVRELGHSTRIFNESSSCFCANIGRLCAKNAYDKRDALTRLFCWMCGNPKW